MILLKKFKIMKANDVKLKNKKFALLITSIFCCIILVSAKIPPNILSHNEMVNILVDLELAKSTAYEYTHTPEESKEIYKKNVIKIYEEYKISNDIFKESYNFYINNPKLLLAVYNDVIDQLTNLLEQDVRA